MQSYNHAAWNPSQPYTDSRNQTSADTSVYRHQTVPAPQPPPVPVLPQSRATDAPPPLPPLPPSLRPGSRHRGQSTSNIASNFFFDQQSEYGPPHRTPDAAPNIPQSFYSRRHAQSYTAGVSNQHPPLPRKPLELQQAQLFPPAVPPKYPGRQPSYTTLPTVPPKVSLYPESIPGPVSRTRTHKTPPEVSISPSDEDKEFEIATRLSERAATEWKQEEDDLAKALEESRISALQASLPTDSPVVAEIVQPANVAHWNLGSSTSLHARSHPSSPMPTDRNPMDTFMQSEGSYTTSPQMQSQFSDDEALAKRIAAGDEPEPVDEHKSSSQGDAHDLARSPKSLYSNAATNIVYAPGGTASASTIVDHELAPPESIPESTLSRDNSVRSASSSQRSAGSGPRTLLSPASRGRDHSPLPGPATTDPSSLSAARPSAAMEKRPLSVMSSQSTVPLSDNSSSIQANQFIEQDLLLGVSLGFGPPAIYTMLKPMLEPMPNTITLPYGKSSPYHLQAPSWRHLLKLMARLSGTRIEPSPEAVAVANRELKLRTVVQFVKVHHLAQEWRILLYLTVDCPVPASGPNAWKYANGDVNTLPYSYTLTALPTLLRDGADSTMTAYYVIPSTPKTPHPTLPIYFPNMAMYLQSALEDSRKAMNDSSSGLRKLAKSVDTYYANEQEIMGVVEGPEKRTFGGVFKKVIGRGNKQSRGNRGGNEEVFELVTPFVPEEWG